MRRPGCCLGERSSWLWQKANLHLTSLTSVSHVVLFFIVNERSGPRKPPAEQSSLHVIWYHAISTIWSSILKFVYLRDLVSRFPLFHQCTFLLLLFLSSLAFRVFPLPMYYVGVAGQRMLCVYYPVWWHVIALSTMYNSISVSRFHYHGACISQIKNLHGDGMSWMPMGRKTGLMWWAHSDQYGRVYLLQLSLAVLPPRTRLLTMNHCEKITTDARPATSFHYFQQLTWMFLTHWCKFPRKQITSIEVNWAPLRFPWKSVGIVLISWIFPWKFYCVQASMEVDGGVYSGWKWKLPLLPSIGACTNIFRGGFHELLCTDTFMDLLQRVSQTSTCFQTTSPDPNSGPKPTLELPQGKRAYFQLPWQMMEDSTKADWGFIEVYRDPDRGCLHGHFHGYFHASKCNYISFHGRWWKPP